jgi:plastocyanin
VFAAAVVAATALSACSSPGPTLVGRTPRPTSPSTGLPDPVIAQGQRIYITPRAFVPKQLISIVDRTITWVNRSSRPQSVVFDHQAVRSGPIPTNGTFRFTPHASVSYTYHDGLHPALRGAIQVEPQQ